MAALAALVATWDARYQQRLYLADLSDEILRDIGRSRQDFAAEAAKPFWRACDRRDGTGPRAETIKGSDPMTPPREACDLEFWARGLRRAWWRATLVLLARRLAARYRARRTSARAPSGAAGAGKTLA
ncbi:hypothetical protein BH23PSE1_BH23PSE1_06120 [soil metagenome]